jgi:hypothetical protein
MRKVLLTQRIQYYTITPFKDYSLLTDKPEAEIIKKLDIKMENIDFFNIFSEDDAVRKIKLKHNIPLFDKAKSKRKTKYYYGDENNTQAVLTPYSSKKEKYHTTNERHLKRHFGRPFSGVECTILERSITVEGDSLSLRVYRHYKHRAVNSIYFKKTKSSTGIKFNFKTGNMIIYDGANKKTATIRQNNFMYLLQTLRNLLNNSVVHYKTLSKDVKNQFDNDEFMETFEHYVLSRIARNKNTMLDKEGDHVGNAFNLLLEAFVNVNGIKVPNDYVSLITKWYPTKKYLKKNENKLVMSILDKLGIKSKSIAKLIHKYPDFDIKRLIALTRFFSAKDLHKYIHNIDENFFITSIQVEDHYVGSLYNGIVERSEFNLNGSEKSLVLKLINETMSQYSKDDILENRSISGINNAIQYLNDHFGMLEKIRVYIPTFEMRATNMEDFHREHVEFSRVFRTIKKGYSIKYVFDQKLIDAIEAPIEMYADSTTLIDTYYPVILKIDGEYTEEGDHMHHCVASYADKENSIIVSLRKDSTMGSERVTSEFSCKDKLPIQARYFCNQKPPENFEEPLAILNARIETYKGSIKSLSKEKVPLVLNGVEIKPTEPESLTFMW